jgi:hypothetical protein
VFKEAFRRRDPFATSAEFLEFFKKHRCYLEDLSTKPVDTKYDRQVQKAKLRECRMNRAKLRDCVPSLISRIQIHTPRPVLIIGIHGSVRRHARAQLARAYPRVPTEFFAFPLHRGRYAEQSRKRYLTELPALLGRHLAIDDWLEEEP